MEINEKTFEVKRGNFTIRGKEYRPSGENLPIAIVCHGFLATYKTTKHYAKQFAEWGYAAYCFDFIGGGVGCTSDGKLSDMSVLTEKEDLYAVIAYVKSLSYTNEHKVTLMGCSQGGFVSAMVAAELKEQVERLILLYPAFCIPDDARKGKMMVFKFDTNNIPDMLSFGPLKLGGNYANAVIEMNPYEQIKGYSGPVLPLHGDNDKIVNLSYARKAKETYGNNCSLSILPKAGHGFKKHEDKYVFYAIREFLNGNVEVLTVDVHLKKIRILPKETGFRTAIAFDGCAGGDYFTGEVLPGAEDVQQWKGLSVVGCRAEYTLAGADYDGAKCEIHIVNQSPNGMDWTPSLQTNSENLNFLNTQECKAYVKLRKKGPFIRIFTKRI